MANPNRKDFDQKWAQGEWAEKRITSAINADQRFFALPFGPSGTAPEDRSERRIYFQRLQGGNRDKNKRPDILVFDKKKKTWAEKIVRNVGGFEELSFLPDEHDAIRCLVSAARVAIECEASLYRASAMPDMRRRNEKTDKHEVAQLRPQPRLEGRYGFAANAKLPNVWIKKEDIDPLKKWQKDHGVPIHIWQFFFDRSYGISFDRALEMARAGYMNFFRYEFPEGTKEVYRCHPACTYEVAEVSEEPTIVGSFQEKPDGQIVADLKFVGGSVRLTNDAIANLLSPHFIPKEKYSDDDFLNPDWPKWRPKGKPRR